MSGNRLIIFGAILTIAFAGFCVWLGLQTFCDNNGVCGNNFQIFLASPPNEKGDTLAGIAGSLAFLWIIITVLLQSNELALQRQELSQTRDTLERQTNFLAAQDNERASLAIDRLIEAKLIALKNLIGRPDFEAFDAISATDNTLRRKHMAWITNKRRTGGISNSELASMFQTFVKNMRLLRDKGTYLVPPDLTSWSEIKSITDEILTLSSNATPAMNDRVKNIEYIEILNRNVDAALTPDIWDIPKKASPS